MTTDPDLHTATLSDGGRLCYRVVGRPGAGLPILLNRPLGGTMRLWGELLGELAREHQVIAFDPRGVGDSSALPLLHSTRDMAGDALQLLQQLRIERACIFGLSLGGMVASWLAIDAPERVERLVLASTLPEPSALSHRFKRHIWKFASSATRPGAEAEVALVNEVLSPHFRHAHPERVREIEAQVRAQPTRKRDLLLLLMAAACHSAESRLRGLPVRTLLLFGQLDPLVGKTARQELMRDLPSATLEMLALTGHDLSLERPHELAASILRFLKST